MFWNKCYDFIISVSDASNKILSRGSFNIVDVVVWPKFDNTSTSMREVIITSTLWGFNQKKHFFCGMVLVQVRVGTGATYGLAILHENGKRIKTKFCRS